MTSVVVAIFYFETILSMAGRSLQDVRDAAVVAYGLNYISDVEFSLLYDYSRSKDIFPYWKFDEFDLASWSDEECRYELRFAKSDLELLYNYLQIPEKIVCVQGSICNGMEALCILLKRLAYPCRYSDMATRFGKNPSTLCLISNTVLNHIYQNHHHRLESWDQPFLSPEQLNTYATSIHNHGAPLPNCFGFVDGTVRRIARPKYLQRVLYNGHKRVHAIKFQSVVIPNGLTANLAGPYEGRRHDSTILQESGLLQNLRRVAHHDGQPLCLYGDPAYPLNVHLQAPFPTRGITHEMEAYNKAMSAVRVSVEWMFGNITKYFSFIDFKRHMKVNLSAVAKMYLVSALLENARTCLYGNIVSKTFDLQPPTLDQYFW